MKGCDVCMKTYNFQEQIENIREEAIKIGYKPTTISKYMSIWRTFIKWKKENNFIYNQDEYSTFLLEHYKFDIITYTHNSKSRDQQLMRSKKILDAFNTYKNFIKKELFQIIKRIVFLKNLKISLIFIKSIVVMKDTILLIL